jgi:hypothetical protein
MTHPPSAAAGTARPLSALATRVGLFLLLGFALLNCGLVWQVRGHILQGYGDFASFYTAGRIVRSGQSARLYDPALQWKLQQQFASGVTTRLGPLPYIRPPFEALLFVPFSGLSYPAASLLWLAVNIILVLAIPFVLPRLDSGGSAGSTLAVNALLCLSFFPIGLTLIQGQDAILLFLILLWVLRLVLRGANFRSGAVLALGLFKFHFILPLLAILILWRKGRLALGFLTVGSFLLLISLFMVHWSGLLLYPHYLWGLNQVPDLGMTTGPQNMPNLRGLFSIWLKNGYTPTAVHGLLVAIVVLGIVVSAGVCRKSGHQSASWAFSFALVVTLVTSYYAKTYDLTLLLLPLLLHGRSFLLSSQRNASQIDASKLVGWPRTCFLAAAGVFLCTPLLWVWVLRGNQFSWIVVALLALALSLFAAPAYAPASLHQGPSVEP